MGLTFNPFSKKLSKDDEYYQTDYLNQSKYYFYKNEDTE